MADMPYGNAYYSTITNESGFQGNIPNIVNTTGGLKDIASRTGADQIDASGIPSIGGLANMQAGTTKASAARQENMLREVKSLPSYASGYRQYLIWRYPTRYGAGAGTSSYTSNFGYGSPVVKPLGTPSTPTGYGNK